MFYVTGLPIQIGDMIGFHLKEEIRQRNNITKPLFCMLEGFDFEREMYEVKTIRNEGSVNGLIGFNDVDFMCQCYGDHSM